MPCQKWECEKCKDEGVVDYEPHSDVLTVVDLIERDHQRKSPKCDMPVAMLRLKGE